MTDLATGSSFELVGAPEFDVALDGGKFLDDVENLSVLLWCEGKMPLPAPPGKLGAQRVEPLAPEFSKRLQPSVDVLQGAGLDGVQPAGALSAYPGEAVLAEHPKVLRDGRLRDAELRADDSHDLPGRVFLVEKQLENPPADPVAQDIECMHKLNVSSETYIRQR